VGAVWQRFTFLLRFIFFNVYSVPLAVPRHIRSSLLIVAPGEKSIPRGWFDNNSDSCFGSRDLFSNVFLTAARSPALQIVTIRGEGIF
jgi:hypothetical protein